MKNEVWDIEGGSLVKAWTNGVSVEPQAREQLERIARMPFIYRWVAAMPDVHLGIGATVGSVIATKRAIIPAAVGVDIGCGMRAVQTNLTAGDLPDNLHAVRNAIERFVPHGRTNNGGPGDRGAWANVPKEVSTAWCGLVLPYEQLAEKHPKAIARAGPNQLGTLGGGNHFIELCLDEADQVWVMLHSGSRGVGNRIGMYFIERARMEMERWFIQLPDRDLAYLPEGSELFVDYCAAVLWAQTYAHENRRLMMDAVLRALRVSLNREDVHSGMNVIDCHHNYVAYEDHYGERVIVTRKGAVRACDGDFGIIPGSMGARSFIVRGKGNPESFHSCSHGAGRAMSRTEARKRFTVADLAEQTKTVECRKDEDVIDELPSAYKDIDAVMRAQADLVDVVHTLKQVLCVKG